MKENVKVLLKIYGICAGAGAALFGTFYAMDAFETKITDKRKLEQELAESERLRKRLEERLEDAESQNTAMDRQLRDLRFANIRLQGDLNVERAKAKAPVESKRSDILVE